jgi:hypothetical protein
MSIANDVDRGIEIRKQITKLEEELEQIEERLKQHGLDHPEKQVELTDTDREGKQFLAESKSNVVPIVFTADLISKSFADHSPKHRMISDALPLNIALGSFYQRCITWELKAKSGKEFRRKADELLGDFAPKFVTACVARDKDGIAKSAIKVEWDRASEVAS